jgi:O-antigen/teichoic acid export membrane protein
MRKLTSKIAPIAGQYSFSIVSLLGFGITFGQNFLFAFFLDKNTFGQVFLVSSLFSAFSYLFVFGLDATVLKYFFDRQFENKTDLSFSIFVTWLKLSAILTFFLLIIGYIFINHLGYALLKFETEYIALVASGMFFSFFLIAQQYFVASRQIWLYTFSSLGIRATVLTFNLAAILLFSARLSYVVYSHLIGTSVFFAISIFLFQLHRWPPLKKIMLKEIRSFSFPLIMNSLISISFTNGYRILISALLPFASLAIYGIISQIATAYYIGLTAFVLPNNSAAYQYLREHPLEKSAPLYRTKLIRSGAIGVIATLIISFFVLRYFKDGIYLEGLKMLPLLLIGHFFFLLYSHDYVVLSHFKKTSRITLSTLIGISLILLNFYPMIAAWQLWGACITVCIGYLGQYLTASAFRAKINENQN